MCTGLQWPRLLPVVLTEWSCLGGAGWSSSWIQGFFSLVSFRLFPFRHFRKPSWLAERLIGSTCTSIGRALALTHSLTKWRLRRAEWYSRLLSRATLTGCFCVSSAHSSDGDNITLLVDLHVCGQRNNAMFPRRPRERILSAFLLSLFLYLSVFYFGELLEDGCHAVTVLTLTYTHTQETERPWQVNPDLCIPSTYPSDHTHNVQCWPWVSQMWPLTMCMLSGSSAHELVTFSWNPCERKLVAKACVNTTLGINSKVQGTSRPEVREKGCKPSPSHT